MFWNGRDGELRWQHIEGVQNEMREREREREQYCLKGLNNGQGSM